MSAFGVANGKFGMTPFATSCQRLPRITNGAFWFTERAAGGSPAAATTVLRRGFIPFETRALHEALAELKVGERRF